MNFTTELIIAISIVGAFFAMSMILMLIRLTRVGVKTLRFDTNGGTELKRMKIRKGKKVLLNSLPTPSKIDDAFICWCENITLSKELEGFIMPASDKKIYAKWNSDLVREKEKAEAEKRKPVFKKVEPTKEAPKAEEYKRPEQPKQQEKPVEVERPQQAARPAEAPRPQQAARPAEAMRPQQTQQAKKPAETIRETDRAAGYQYQFRQSNANASQTYAYSKYNSADQERLEKQKHDEKVSRNYAKLELISEELHYSVESLSVLDEQNIDILYRKAEKSRKAKQLEEMNKQRELYRANLKKNQYAHASAEEEQPSMENAQPKAEENQPNPSMENVQPEIKVEPKREENKVENVEAKVEAEKEEIKVESKQQGYSSQINNFVIDEVVEEAEDPVVEDKKIEPQHKEEVKAETTEKKESSKPKNAERIAKLDQINKNFDKLNNELAELKELLLRSIR